MENEDKIPVAPDEGSSGESGKTRIREGKAEIIFPAEKAVFYNPVQEFNRDISSAVIRLVCEDIDKWTKRRNDEKGDADKLTRAEKRAKDNLAQVTILEGLAASGLRSVRYALEVPGIHHVIANDISADAFSLIENNVKHNKVNHIVSASKNDASLLMYQYRYPASRRFTFIDLDPYGTAAPFLDGAVQAVADGGVLLVTCTDMGVLCGNHNDACYGKYGGMSLKAKFCHEMALRLLLSSIESHANRYKRYILPLLSMSVDFYIRVFVQVFTSASEVKRTASKQSLVYHCTGCGSFHFQQVGRRIEEGVSKKYPPALGPPVDRSCDQCGGKFHLGGPIWTEPMHDTDFVTSLAALVKQNTDLYKTSDRIIGLLSMVAEELPTVPLFHTIDHLSNVIHCSSPSIVQFRSALLRLGYKVSGSHVCPTAVKTDAPNNVLWDVMRCWEKINPVKKRPKGSPASAILSKDPQIQASFEMYPGANPPSRQQKLLRFQENPEANWGPKARAKRKADTDETMTEKRRRLQGKRASTVDHKQFPCKRFKAGICKYDKDECKYSHDVELCSPRKRKVIQAGTKKEEEDSAKKDKSANPAEIEKQRRNSLLEAEHSLLF
ncbi:predicted protein [Nematostella vectensis]|uniref:tRNA (guanine(26)-N(2))-dimethyltransferase n=1 Tax=Nematostella vectensis TaxID=45351 RepID=A7RIG7_NEMVE|nr:predicted protein [Nematostella vectensis]|eukprot:XP_001640869.1 predicted protein [Nematostella vectensis]